MYIKCIFKICDKALVTAKALESFARKTEIADYVYKVASLKKSKSDWTEWTALWRNIRV